jgi:membrane-bound metal-dependent hydrolase YbcI (DUF457 family)
MNQKILFKRLLIISFVFNFLSTFYSFFFTPEEINKINDSLLPNISEELRYILIVILILAVLINFSSYFFLYNFKKIGKLFFIVPLFIMLSIQLFIPNASDGLQLLLDTVICLADGGIITLMYFTNINREFDN